MGWLQRLVETYDACSGAEQFEQNPVPPVCHTPQQAHIEIVLDAEGNFRRAQVLQKEETLVAATEESAGRTGTKPPPHPLCDKIQYVARDYVGDKPSFYCEYLTGLTAWCDSPFCHPKVHAVRRYVEHGTVVADLLDAGILYADGSGKLLTKWEAAGEKPDIFRFIAPDQKTGSQDQGNLFVRWRVEDAGDPQSAVWSDAGVQKSWTDYYTSKIEARGLCIATGSENVPLASSHPKRLRHAGDGAKLVSSNDAAGFTFRGRFADKDEAGNVGYVASQKAHIALRWLIDRRQASRNGEQVVIAWSIGGEDIPDPLATTAVLLGLDPADAGATYAGDAGQAWALALRAKIAGYRADLPADSTIVLMGLDSASPGRMSIIFYREFGGAEFLDRIERWHTALMWPQRYSTKLRFIGAPAPRDIAEAAYGAKIDDKLRKACVERILPCITDGRPLPRDLVESAARRAAQRAGIEAWEWEKTLGIACSLYKGYHPERNYQVALEEDRTSRDYLYGRLLAIAERTEAIALRKAGEKERDTSAARLMHRFSNHPYSTWRSIELALQPYKSRLRSSTPGLLFWLDKQADEVFGKFQDQDFMSDSKLSAEFLLGYHCQRAKLFESKKEDEESENSEEEVRQ